MKKSFVTIFEKTENIHLIKDVGQIPYLMHQYFNYKSTIVTYKNSNTYSYLNTETKGLLLQFIPKIKLGRYSLSILWYIFKNAKNIDVLNLYHHRDKTYLNFLLYKLRNPHGIAFLKSDIGLKSVEENQNFYPKRFKYFMRHLLFKQLLPKIDIISIESKEGYNIISNQIYPQYKDKFLYLPNGINIDKMHSIVKPKSFEEKENLIITVGRIGAPEKNNELLLNAMEYIDLEEWKVIFIGPIEEPFKQTVNDFFDKHPNLKDKVIFTGPIYERNKLYEWYARSKVFCLTSFAEGSPLVFPEALSYGNFLVTTDISGAYQATNNQQFGIVIQQNNLSELVRTLRNIQPHTYLNDTNSTIDFTKLNFNWLNILTLLEEKISNIKKVN